jgi:uncharacterized protein
MKFFITSKLSENIAETPEGYLVCSAVPIARTGEQIYQRGETPLEADTDGKVVVQRDPDEVFRKETIASFEGKSVTLAHPDDFVNPDNWAQLTHGIVQNVRRGQGGEASDLLADFLITDSDAIQLVKNGLREVSCGYEAEYVQTGLGRGLQKNIIGNHVALVSEGRAGAAYAIKDHKGKGPMKLTEKIKAIFGKAQDEALAIAKTIDEAAPEEKKDKPSYDALCKAVKDLGEMVAGMKPVDVSSAPTQTSAAEIVAKDKDAAPSMEERMKKMEDDMAALKKPAADADEGEEAEESEDMDGEEEEVVEDADEEKKDDKKTGDSAAGVELASRVEILAPGLKAKGKDAKVLALQEAFKTTDGQAAIKLFTGGKDFDPKDEKLIDVIFIGASEFLKSKRRAPFADTKVFDFGNSALRPTGAMTPEMLNEKYAKHYAQAK